MSSPSENTLPTKTLSAPTPTMVNFPAVAATLTHLDSSPTLIPPEVIAHIMARQGCTVDDEHVLRFVEVAARQYISSLVSEAKEHRNLLANTPNETKIITRTDINYALHVKDQDDNVHAANFYTQ